MKMKNLLSIFVIFLLSVCAASALDLSPVLSFTSDATTTNSTVTFTATAVDIGENQGIDYLNIYENGTAIATKNCNRATTCVLVRQVVKPEAGVWVYNSETSDISAKRTNSNNITVTYTGYNFRPSLNISDVSVMEDSGVTYNLVDLWAASHDMETQSQNLVFSIIDNSNPSLGTVEVNSSRYIKFTTAANISGYADVTVRVTDGDKNYDDTFRLTVVEVNDLPYISPAIAAVTIVEDDPSGAVIDLTANENDVESSADGLNWSFAYNTAKLNITATDLANDVFTIMGLADVFGEFNVMAVLTDAHNGTSSQSFLVNITPVNDAPRINASNPFQNITWQEDTNYTLNLRNHIYDVEGDNLTFSFQPSSVTNIAVTINQTTGLALFVPDAAWNGARNIQFIADDGQLQTLSDVIVLNVTPTNTPPSVNFSGLDANMTEDTQRVIGLDNYVADPDNADSEINWTASGYSHANVTIDNLGKTVTIIPAANYTGNISITFTATDPLNASNSKTVVFVVNPVNDAPTFSGPIANITVMENQSASINLRNYFSDIDGDALNFSVSATTNIAIAINSTTGIANLTPTAGWNGTESFTFVADDGLLTANSNTVYMTVMHINRAPDVNFTGIITTITEDWTVQHALDAYVSDPDNSDAEMTWITTESTNANISINNTASPKTVTITPAANFTGNISIEFTATDPLNATDSEIVVFTVTPVNDAPVLAQNIPNTTVYENYTSTLNLASYFNDVDGDALTYTASAVQNVTITFSGSVASITPVAGIGNVTRTVVFTVNDSAFSVNSNTVTLTITTRPPVSELINSYVNGTLYNGNYSNGQVPGVNAFTYMLNSNVTDAVSNINNTRLVTSTVTNSWLVDSNATSSTVINSYLTRCRVENATVKNYQASDCTILNSVVDPPSGMSDLTGSNVTGNSHIYSSNVTYSNVYNSIINGSNVNISTVNDSSVYDSTVYNSTLTNGSIVRNSTVRDSTLNHAEIVNASILSSSITNSKLDNLNATGSTIVNTNLSGVNLTNANVTNGVLYNGTIGNYTYNGTPVNVTDVVNVKPDVANFVANPASLTTGGTVTFTWTVSDSNIGGALNDSVSVFLDFGDGANATFNSTATTTTHVYSSAATFSAKITATDKFSANDTESATIAVSAPASSGGGHSGGGGGSGRIAPGTFTLNFDGRTSLSKIVREKDVFKLTVKKQNHTITIVDVNREGVTMTIASTPFTAVIQKGTTKKFNLDGDNTYDLGIAVLNAGPETAQVRFDLLNETVIRPTFTFLPEFDIPEDDLPPAPVAEPEPTAEPAQAPEPALEPAAEPEHKPMGKLWMGLLIMLIVVAAGLVGYFVVREVMIRREGLVY